MKGIPLNKTKIICTIGPASESQEVIERMLKAGMNVARLNFSHGDLAGHRRVIQTVRAASRAAGRRVAILADLSGPKIRIGRLRQEHLELRPGDTFILTTQEVIGDQSRASVSFSRFPKTVKPGDNLYLDDGFIQLRVAQVKGSDAHCKVIVGGELRSRIGLNLPGIDLGIPAFTERDRDCLKFALKEGVEAVSQSFVESGKDIEALRSAANKLGHNPFIFAKIERARALDQIEGILKAADGIMIARGDLGVEIPIEKIAVVQKQLIRQANCLGKPVITATQMLESMTTHSRPTRAEATDVANAILDGTDCVMLSGESALGKYPVESVAMLARIAEVTECHRPGLEHGEKLSQSGFTDQLRLTEIIASSVESALQRVMPAVVIVPTRSGATARSISRYRLPVWILGVSSQDQTCQKLQFTYGVYPEFEPEHPEDWKSYARKWLKDHKVPGDLVILTEGPSSKHPDANHRMEIIDLKQRRSDESQRSASKSS